MNICYACQKQTDSLTTVPYSDENISVCNECLEKRRDADELHERIKAKWIDFKEGMLKHHADWDAKMDPCLNICKSYNCVHCGNKASAASLSKKDGKYETIYMCIECSIIDQFKTWLHRALV